MKDPFSLAEGRAFSRVLADVGRSGGASSHRAGRALNPAANAAFPFIDGEADDSAPVDPTDWFVELDEPLPIESDEPLSESPEAIALELGLDRAVSEEDLSRAKRRFMWRNHPDRRGQSQRGNANRRVAIANMLIDRARAKLAAGRRG